MKLDVVVSKMWNSFEKVLKKVFFSITHKLHINIDNEKWNLMFQFIKFGMVGVLNTLISYVTYVLINLMGYNYHIANISAFIISVLNSFYWNHTYVFKTNGQGKSVLLKALIKTFISYGFSGLILTELLLILWIQILNISKYIAPLLNLILTIPINFLLNKFWAFRDK